MNDLMTWVVLAIITENVILSRFLGICPFIGISKKTNTAFGMGMAVVFVMTISSLTAWVLYHYILEPLQMVYMRTIVFILVIASLVQIIEIFMKKVIPGLYRSLGIYLPLITTNCAILGMAAIVTGDEFSFLKTLVYSFASGIGFLFVIYLFSTLRERIEAAPVPKGFKGAPIALIIAGIMAMIFARFAGIV